MKNRKTHIVTVITGIIVALAIICSNVLQFSLPKQTSSIEVKAEKQDKAQDERSYVIAAPTLTLPSTFLVNLSIDSYCLFEIVSLPSSDEEDAGEAPPLPQRYLLTLFRVIISPNAP